MTTVFDQEQVAVYRDGQVELTGPVDWPSGTRLTVRPVESPPKPAPEACGPVVVAGCLRKDLKSCHRDSYLVAQSHAPDKSLEEMIQMTADTIDVLIEAFFGGSKRDAQEDIQNH